MRGVGLHPSFNTMDTPAHFHSLHVLAPHQLTRAHESLFWALLNRPQQKRITANMKIISLYESARQSGEFDSQSPRLKTRAPVKQTTWFFSVHYTRPGFSIYVKTHMCLCYHGNKSLADSAAEHALSKLGKSGWTRL